MDQLCLFTSFSFPPTLTAFAFALTLIDLVSFTLLYSTEGLAFRWQDFLISSLAGLFELTSWPLGFHGGFCPPPLHSTCSCSKSWDECGGDLLVGSLFPAPTSDQSRAPFPPAESLPTLTHGPTLLFPLLPVILLYLPFLLFLFLLFFFFLFLPFLSLLPLLLLLSLSLLPCLSSPYSSSIPSLSPPSSCFPSSSLSLPLLCLLLLLNAATFGPLQSSRLSKMLAAPLSYLVTGAGCYAPSQSIAF